MKSYDPLSKNIERIGKEIVNSAFAVHKSLGPGLLESVYEACFCHELKKRGHLLHRQVSVPIQYDGQMLDDSLRLDVLVDNSIICELKAAEGHNRLWEAQLLSYLKLSGHRLGYLINFNVSLI